MFDSYHSCVIVVQVEGEVRRCESVFEKQLEVMHLLLVGVVNAHVSTINYYIYVHESIYRYVHGSVYIYIYIYIYVCISDATVWKYEIRFSVFFIPKPRFQFRFSIFQKNDKKIITGTLKYIQSEKKKIIFFKPKTENF